MSTYSVITKSAEETEALAEKLGSNLKGGEVFEMKSDLGGGKTTFTRGLVAGTGSQDAVSSPTFMVHKPYKAPHFTIDHFDFYRLPDPGLITHTLAEHVEDPNSIIVVEWPETLEAVLPKERLTVTIERTAMHEGERKITIEYPEPLEYVISGVDV